jgi:hypothetical protein
LKTLRYLLIGLVAATIAAAIVVHVRREAVVRNLANRILEGSDLTVSDLTLEKLGTEELRLVQVVVEQNNGTSYDVRGLRMKLSLPSTKVSEIGIERLIVTPAESAGAPMPVADILRTVLALPVRFPGISVTIDETTMSGYPLVESLQWETAGPDQNLRLTVEDVVISAAITTSADSHQSISLEAVTEDGEPVFHSKLDFELEPQGYSIDGSIKIGIQPSITLLDLAGSIPKGELVLAETFAGPVHVWIDADPEQQHRLSTELSSVHGGGFFYTSEDETFQVSGDVVPHFNITGAFPSMEWQLDIAPVAARVRAAVADKIDVVFNDVSCHTDWNCEFSLASELTGARFGDFQAQSIEVDSNMSVLIEGGSINVSSDLANVQVRSVQYGDDLLGTLPIALEQLQIGSAEWAVTGLYSIRGRDAKVSWGQMDFLTPDIQGNFSIGPDATDISVSVAGPNASLAAEMNVELRPQGTSVSVKHAAMSFVNHALSKHLHHWPYEWDVVGGTLLASGNFSWLGAGDEAILTGRVEIAGDDIAGTFGDPAAPGVRGRLDSEIQATAGHLIGPATIEVALLDIGLPIQDLVAKLSWDNALQAAHIESLSMQTLGGSIRAEPFVYSLQSRTASIRLDVAGVQLALMSELAKLDSIRLSGSLSGTLPTRISDATVTIDGGLLESEGSGGVIRYLMDAGSSDQSGIGIAARALSNFQYESLVSDVSYSEQGDLKLQMRIKGINPDMDARQPVILNLGIENNVPQLLRSLQATRDIEEVLELRGRRQ